MNAVIVAPTSHMAAARRLCDYCFTIDGTRVDLIHCSNDEERHLRQVYASRFSSEQIRNCVAAYSLRKAANKYRKQPFFWLEPDAIPLKPQWLNAIEKEYRARNKPYLISSDSNPPFDMVGGIGVYGPDTYWQLPTEYYQHGWDLWMIKYMAPLIARTPLIQHNYGTYSSDGTVSYLHMAQHKSLIRQDAVIYHKDHYQELLPAKNPLCNVFVHSGHCGDLLAAMPSIRSLGGGRMIITQTPFTARHSPMKGFLYESLRPLVAFQPYILDVEWQDSPVGFSHDMREFRSFLKNGVTLAQAQARFLGCQDSSQTPWLSAPVNPEFSNRIAVTRSARYRNPLFPWKRLVDANRSRMVFLGTQAEHADFTASFGSVEYYPTPTLLDVASAINAADLLICNQSSPFWIAAGLGKRIVQEQHQTIKDTVVTRENTLYVSANNVNAIQAFGVAI